MRLALGGVASTAALSQGLGLLPGPLLFPACALPLLHQSQALAHFSARTVRSKRISTATDKLIAAFHKAPEELDTAALVDLIKRKILDHVTPHIAGVVGPARELDVAAFLYEIGFFFARRDNPDGTYDHIGFSEKPSLLRARTALDEGLRWEIHPVFRQALEMRDPAGFETAPSRRSETPRPGMVRRKPPPAR